MAFKFRLETTLNLAEQEMKIEQSFFSKEMRILQNIIEQRDIQSGFLEGALKGQKKACLEDPLSLGLWQRYSREQKEKYLTFKKQAEEQQKKVDECKEKLLQCRIKVEKYRRLKDKKLRAFYIEELKIEQKTIDELAKAKTNWKLNNT